MLLLSAADPGDMSLSDAQDGSCKLNIHLSKHHSKEKAREKKLVEVTQSVSTMRLTNGDGPLIPILLCLE